MVDEIEGDAQRSADGVWVMFHDATVVGPRCTPSYGKSISSLTWSQISGIRCSGEPIPKLADVLAIMKANAELQMALEVKVTGSQTATTKVAQARSVAAAVQAAGLTDRVILESFSWRDILPGLMITHPRQRVAAQEWGVPKVTAVQQAKRLGAFTFSYQAKYATRFMSAFIHSQGMPTVTWTANDSVSVQLQRARGVDVPMTDRPTMAAAAQKQLARCAHRYRPRTVKLVPSGTRMTKNRYHEIPQVSDAPRMESAVLKITTTVPNLRVAAMATPYTSTYERAVPTGTSTVHVPLAPDGYVRLRSTSGGSGSLTVTVIGDYTLGCS